MSHTPENLAFSAEELFLLAFVGSDPQPAISMIRDYGLSGLYMSIDNIPDYEAGPQITDSVGKAAKTRDHSLHLLFGVDQEGTWSVDG